MGSSQSRMSKEKFKRKKDEEAPSEDSSSRVATKKLKLSENSDTAGNDEVVEASDSEGCKDEVLVMKEKSAPASSQYSEGLVSILSSCLQCVVCGEYPRGRPLYSCPLHHHTCAECHQVGGGSLTLTTTFYFRSQDCVGPVEDGSRRRRSVLSRGGY